MDSREDDRDCAAEAVRQQAEPAVAQVVRFITSRSIARLTSDRENEKEDEERKRRFAAKRKTVRRAEFRK